MSKAREKQMEEDAVAADKILEEVYGAEEPPQTEEPPQQSSEENVAAQTVAPVVPPVPEEDWKHKYSTLMGKYNAEVPLLSQEGKQWKESCITLNGKISELNAQISELQNKAAAVESDADLDKLSTDYPDIGSVIKKVNERHRQEIKALEERFSKSVSNDIENIKQDQEKDKRIKFDEAMRLYGVPDWKEIDVDPEWIKWLEEPIPYTNGKRIDFLRNAASNHDASLVSKFFLDFKKGKVVPAPPETRSMEQYVAPPKNNVGGGQTATKPKYTREQYVSFMKESAKGKFNPAKWGGKTELQVEQDFDAAIASGLLA